jgi:hypothetical protein
MGLLLPAPASTANDITGFTLAAQAATAVIDNAAHTVVISVVNGTNILNLTPTITVSPSATISPVSGMTRDFTNSVNYTVTAQDGSVQIWTVTVSVVPAIKIAGNATGNDTVTLTGPANTAINASDKTWTINVTQGTVKAGISNNDLNVTGMPLGLSWSAVTGSGNNIDITVSGSASIAVLSEVTLNVTVKASAVTQPNSTNSDIITVKLVPGPFQITGNATGNATVSVLAPGNTNISSFDNTWTLNVTSGTVKTGVTESELTITGLPAGITATAVKGTGNTIVITVAGIAGPALSADVTVSIVVESSAVNEQNASASAAITVSIIRGILVAGNATGNNTVTMQGPAQINVSGADNTWVLTVTNGTVKTGLGVNDVDITGLPAGLIKSVAKGSNNTIVVTLSGTAVPALTGTVNAGIVIKGSAVTEAGAVDSVSIPVTIQVGTFQIAGNATTNNTVKLTGPDQKEVDLSDPTWTITLTSGTVKGDVDKDDLDITGLPAGLVVTAAKGSGNMIDLIVSGPAVSSVSANTTVNIVIKDTAVTETGATQSIAIPVNIHLGAFQIVTAANDTSVDMGLPTNKTVGTNSSWELFLTAGHVKLGVTANDLIITGLPAGLTTSAVKGAGDSIIVTVSGTATAAVTTAVNVTIVIKTSAVLETVATASAAIPVTIMPGVFKITANATGNDTVTMAAPARTSVSSSDNTWILNVTTGTVKAGVSLADLTITGLPVGLSKAAAKGTGNTIVVTVSGTAQAAVNTNPPIDIEIKSSAVTEPSATISDKITVNLLAGTFQIMGNASANNTIKVFGPEQTDINPSDNTWTVTVTNSTVNPGVSESDLDITGLPAGMICKASWGGASNTIDITVTGKATKGLTANTMVNIYVLESAVSETSASPSAAIPVTINIGQFQITGDATSGGTDGSVSMIAPVNKSVDTTNNSWFINVSKGTVKAGLTLADLTMSLPAGLTAVAEKGSGNTILITVSGTTGSAIAAATNISVIIKPSAVLDVGATASAAITVKLLPGTYQVTGSATGNDTVTMQGPARTTVSSVDSTWVLTVTQGTVKAGVGNSDITVTGLPAGLSFTATKGTGNTIIVIISGTTSTAVTADESPTIRIKGSAVTESGAQDSGPITVEVKAGVYTVVANATGNNTVTMQASANTDVSSADNTWVLNVTGGTVKPGVSASDLTVSGLPANLTYAAAKGTGNTVVITISGTASSAISSIVYPVVKLNASALVECITADKDSAAIPVSILPGLQVAVTNSAGISDNMITMVGPAQRMVSGTDKTWLLNVTTGTVKANVSETDLGITNLPAGLTATAVKGSGNTIVVTVIGTANQAVSSLTNVNIVVKGSAVTEMAAIDSGTYIVKVNFGSFQIAATASAGDTVKMDGPVNKNVDGYNNTWILYVSNGTVNPDINGSHLSIPGLLGGLSKSVSIGTGNTIVVTVSGSVGVSIAASTELEVVILPGAILEAGAVNSAPVTVKIVPEEFLVEATLTTDNTVGMNAPDQKTVNGTDNTWTIDVNSGTLDTTVTASDLTITGMPAGLTATAIKLGTKQIKITIIGTASYSVNTITEVSVVVKGSAVTEIGAVDSQPITFQFVPALDVPEVTFDFDGINANKLIGADSTMEYSVDGGVSYTAITLSNQTIDSTKLALITAANDIRIRKKAVGATPAGNAAIINILAAPAAPTVTFNTQTGATTGTTAAMEYSYDNGAIWLPFSGSNEVLSAGILAGLNKDLDFKVRVKAVGQTLASTVKTINILLSSAAIDLSTVVYDISEKRLHSGNLASGQVILYRVENTAGGTWSAWKLVTVNATPEAFIADPQSNPLSPGKIQIRLINFSNEASGTDYVLTAIP